MGLLAHRWSHLWMKFAGRNGFGRMASRLAAWPCPPLYGRVALAQMSERGYVSADATLFHSKLRLGKHVCIDDDVLIFEDWDGGAVELGNGVHLWRGVTIQSGQGGTVAIGDDTHIQPRCQFSAYKSAIKIGRRVEVAPNCAFYPYDHGLEPDKPICEQGLLSRGPILIEDDCWLGFGVVVLSGVHIGRGAVIGAGAVVTRDIPAEAIAGGIPAKIVRWRGAAAVMNEKDSGSI